MLATFSSLRVRGKSCFNNEDCDGDINATWQIFGVRDRGGYRTRRLRDWMRRQLKRYWKQQWHGRHRCRNDRDRRDRNLRHRGQHRKCKDCNSQRRDLRLFEHRQRRWRNRRSRRTGRRRRIRNRIRHRRPDAWRQRQQWRHPCAQQYKSLIDQTKRRAPAKVRVRPSDACTSSSYTPLREREEWIMFHPPVLMPT
jgi:hypothetical protein